MWAACSVSPSAEVCNGVDDDCDGQVDNNPLFSPGELTDAGFSSDGGCTAGVGACAMTGPVTCNTGALTCSAMAGTPAAESCNGIDDDCDGAVDEGLLIGCLPDGDNDGFAGPGSIATKCFDASRQSFGYCPSGFVAPSSSSGPDCNDTDSSRHTMKTLRADADGDQRCVGPSTATCAGANAPPGQRLATGCNVTDDCNDMDPLLWANVDLRRDEDNDGYCAATVYNRCVGNIPPAGYRFAAGCPLDCKDTNAYATTSCSVAVDSVTNKKTCGVGYPPTETRSFSYVCPTLFTGVTAVPIRVSGSSTDPGSFVFGPSPVNVPFTCRFAAIGEDTWRLRVTCNAL